MKFPNLPQSFHQKFSSFDKHSPQILGCSKFLRLFKDQNPKTVVVFPYVVANIRHLFTKYLIWLFVVPNSPIGRHARQLVTNVCRAMSKQSPYCRLVIADFANYSPIPSIFCFANCSETVWWANDACGDYFVNIQRTFREKVSKC